MRRSQRLNPNHGPPPSPNLTMRRSPRLNPNNGPPPPRPPPQERILGQEFPELFDVRNEPRQNQDFANDKGEAILGPAQTEEGGDFLSTYAREDWLPSVRDQGDLPICWALSSAQQVGASICFRRRYDHPQVPLFSPQCLINGPPKLTRRGEIEFETDEGGIFYQSSTYLALSFIWRRGICEDYSYPLVGTYPFLGYYMKDEDRVFERNAEIVRPFRIPVNISTTAIERVLERHGPILGSFYCTDTLDDYTRPPTIYEVPESTLLDNDDLDTHCAEVVGVGRLNGKTFLHIQNTGGTDWGDNGFGYISLHLFHQLQGLTDAFETIETIE